MKVSKQIYTEESLEITGVTLLSIEEADKFLTREERCYDCWWWLRSPGYTSDIAAYVHYVGDVYYFGYGVDYGGFCVRPALKINNLESSNFRVGDIFRINGYDFKIISHNLAFMFYQDIGRTYFDEEKNDYENSHIKKYVDEWFEKEIERKVKKGNYGN